MDRESAEAIERQGGQRYTLPSPKIMQGAGGERIKATEYISTHIKLTDGILRKIDILIVPHLPFRIIIGQPFMVENSLGVLLSKKKGLQIYDHSAVNENQQPRLAYSSDDIHFETSPDHNQCTIIADAPATMNRKPSTRKRQRKSKLRVMTVCTEELDMINTLASIKLKTDVKLVDVLPKLPQPPPDEWFTTLQDDQGKSYKKLRKDIPCDFPEFQETLNNLVNCHWRIFSTEASDVGKTKGPKVHIKLEAGTTPVSQPPYRTPLRLRDALRKNIKELEEAGIIERSDTNPFSSPCLLVPKKADTGMVQMKCDPNMYRLVIDYRKLNQVIENVVFPMPRIQDILMAWKGCRVFSTVDIRHAFHTVELDEASRAITAFACELGKWQFKFLPQGLKISPAIFQQRITDDLSHIPRSNPYMDDIGNADKEPDEHLSHMDVLFTTLGHKGYKLKLSKCHLLKKVIPFTGFNVSAQGASVSPTKIDDVQRLRPPRTISEVKSLLGFTSFLRGHVPYYCDVVGPIQKLLQNKVSQCGDYNIEKLWETIQDTSLKTLKNLLSHPETLAFPDPSKAFILYTDASRLHMSAVLMQPADEDLLRPIGYWSKSFHGSQLLWAALVKEARAVYEAVKHFDVFIRACEIELRCDHKPLQRFLHTQCRNEMANRWSLSLQEYNIKFVHVTSQDNVSDCLSRLIQEKLFIPHPDPPEDLKSFPIKSKFRDDGKLTSITSVSSIATGLKAPITTADELRLMGVDPSTMSAIRNWTPLSLEEMAARQDSDNYCKRIKKQLDTGEMENHGWFTVKEGLLYRVVENSTTTKERRPTLALVLPKCLVATVLISIHQELLHPGRDRMLQTLRSRVFWKHMGRAVQTFVNGCQICRLRCIHQDQLKSVRIRPPFGPGKRIAIDLWQAGNTGVLCLTAICLFAQFPFAEIVRNKTTTEVIDKLQNILAFMGNVTEVVSDNGPEFASEEMNEFFKARNIRHVLTPPHSPHCNGIIERFHRFLNQVIRLSVNLSNAGDVWPAIRAAVETYRKTPHSSAGETPMFLFNRQEPVFTIDHLLPTTSNEVWCPESNKWDLTQIKVANALARKNIALSRLKNHKKGASRSPIQAGDRVYVRKTSDHNKLEFFWAPGYRVLDIPTSRRAVVEDTNTGQKLTRHIVDLKKADPISELLGNTSIDVIPGRSRLLFQSRDLPNLNWPAIEGLEPLDENLALKANEIVRDRYHDTKPQPPVKGGEKESNNKRPVREKQTPLYLRDYVTVNTILDTTL